MSGGDAAQTPAHYVGAESCGECHRDELTAWKRTAHQRGYLSMHRLPAAKEIARRLGVKRIKRDPGCISCHYAPKPESPKLRAATGVACESCHGPAAHWLDVHSSYGDADATRETETETHRAARQQRSLASGMNPPFALDRLLRRCYDCHLVADRELVEVGGHPLASIGFEAVAWSQGEVRHNYCFSDGEGNRETSPRRRQQMYAIGRSLELEAILRAQADAGSAGPYTDGLSELGATALEAFAAIVERAPHPALQEAQHALAALAAGSSLKGANARPAATAETPATAPTETAAPPAPPDRQALLAAADALATTAASLAQTDDPDAALLAALEALLPAPASYRGTAQP